MAVELSKEELEMALKPVGTPDPGSHIERFDPNVLAYVISHEVYKARQMKLTKLRIDVTLEDAMALARFLMERR